MTKHFSDPNQHSFSHEQAEKDADTGRLQQEESKERVLAQHYVSYLEDELLIALTESGSLFVSLPSLCTALHLNARGQLQRIQRTAHLLDGLRQLPLKTRGGIQAVNCLRLETLSRWAAGIQVQGTKSVMQDKITAYQRGDAHTHLLATILGEEQHLATDSDSFSPLPGVKHTLQAQQIVDATLEQQTLPLIEEVLEGAFLDTYQELRTLLAQTPEVRSASTLATTSYQEDRAIREASLARTTDWHEEPEYKRMRFLASNKLTVYVGDPDIPLDIQEAMEKIHDLGETTVLTGRILLGIWNIRRCDNQLAKDGTAPIRIDDILEWRGVQKHSRISYKGSEKRTTDGYQWKHKQQVHRDIKSLEQCYLRGQHTVMVKGRARKFLIDGPYLRVASVKETTNGEEGEVVGYFVAPGAWINTYQENGNLFLAEVDRRIFQLNPQNDQIALRIALYLTEYWRQQARTGNYDEPLMMEDVLIASMVAIDRTNLTARFIPRIEAALEKLRAHGIVGNARPLAEVDRNQPQWGKQWLATYWTLTPPRELTHLQLPKQRSTSTPPQEMLESGEQ